MLVLAVLSVATLALALGVLAFAAFLHHGPPVARAGRPSRALAGLFERATLPETHPSYGVLLRPDRDERGRDRFVAAEQRLQRGVDRLRRSPSAAQVREVDVGAVDVGAVDVGAVDVGAVDAAASPATSPQSDGRDGSRSGFGPGWALLPGAVGEPAGAWGAASSPAAAERRTGVPGAAASG